MSVQQPGAEALITDEQVAASLWAVQAGLEQEAIATVRAEGMPEDAHAAVVRFSGEAHDVTVTVQESQLAKGGLWRWFRRKPADVNVSATVEDHADPTKPPIEVYLKGKRTGRYLLEPVISGTYVTQPEIIAQLPKGELFGSLGYELAQMTHQRPPVISTQVLRRAVDAVRAVKIAKTVVSVEAPGEQLSNVAFVGNEVRKVRAVVDPFIAAYQDDIPQFSNQDILNGDAPSALRLTNELHAPTVDCAITVEINTMRTTIHIKPAAKGIWADIPALHLAGTTNTPDANDRNLTFLDEDDRVYPLTHMQRQQLTMLLEEELQPFKFGAIVDERVAEQPDAAVLAACEKLAGAIDEPDPRSYTWAVEIDDTMVGRTLAIQRTSQGFTVTAMQNGGVLCALCISNGGCSTWQGARPVSPRAILDVYDAIRNLAA
jgi:hypothetical protein